MNAKILPIALGWSLCFAMATAHPARAADPVVLKFGSFVSPKSMLGYAAMKSSWPFCVRE